MAREIQPGGSLPGIILKDQNDCEVDLHSFLGKPLVVYFYPKDETPGCTAQACGLRDHYEEFLDAGAAVVGISSDSVSSHKLFAEKFKLPFTLLADTKKEARRAFGVPSNLMGFLPGRVTYVFDSEGKLIRKFNSQLMIDKHIGESLRAIRSLIGA